MKDELQLKLVEILTQIQDGVSKAGTFAAEQLPDIAQQYMVYGLSVGIFWFLFATTVFVFLVYVTCTKGFFSKDVDGFGDWPLQRFLCAFLGAIASIVSAIAFFYSAQNLLLISLAPKVWLIKEIAGLVK